jgi:peptide/nickel transport system substrate-binding protein
MDSNHSQTLRGTSRRTLLKGAAASAALPFMPWGAVAATGPAASGSITVGSAVDIINFDPYAQTINSLILLKNLNAWLIDYDENLRPIPSALESFQIAPDRAGVTLRIRPDVTFHSGKKMTVDDVVFAFERALDPKRGFNLAAATNDLVAAVKATTQSEVVLTLKQPTSTTLVTDLLVGQPVLDHSKNESALLAKEPGSAGPYRVEDWRQGESLTLQAFPDWYGGKPKTSKIVMRFFTSPSTAVTALASGSLDVLVYPQPRDAQRLQSDFQILTGYPGASTMLLRVNTKTPPFDNRTVRQALQRSLNRDRIVQTLLFGYGEAAHLPWGPNSPANDRSLYGEVSYDLNAAKGLLAQSGGKMEGNALVNGSDPTSLLVMQIIQADLASIGFKLNIEQADTATFASRLVAGDFGVVLGGIGGGQLSLPRIVQNSLMRLANNPLWPNGTPPEAYIRGMRTLISEDDPAKRQETYRTINRVIIDEAWAIGAYYIPTLFAHKKDLHGVARDHQNALVLANAAF